LVSEAELALVKVDEALNDQLIREKESKMVVAKRQGRSKEGPRTRVKTSGRTNSSPG